MVLELKHYGMADFGRAGEIPPSLYVAALSPPRYGRSRRLPFMTERAEDRPAHRHDAVHPVGIQSAVAHRGEQFLVAVGKPVSFPEPNEMNRR